MSSGCCWAAITGARCTDACRRGYGRQAQIVGVIFFREPVRAQIAVLFNQRGGAFAITDYKGIGSEQ